MKSKESFKIQRLINFDVFKNFWKIGENQRNIKNLNKLENKITLRAHIIKRQKNLDSKKIYISK